MRAFPMLLIVVVLYNLVAFGGAAIGYHDMPTTLAHGATIQMASGDKWTATLGDGFVLLAFFLLLAEMLKAAASTTRAILSHVLSLAVFAGALAEFLLLKGFATSTFFTITVMALFDAVAGISVSIIGARQDHDQDQPVHHDGEHAGP